MFKLSNKSKLNMEGVHHNLATVAERAIQISAIDFGIPPDGGLRTASRQAELFYKKLSKADGYVKKSKHQSGNAIDFYAYVDGKGSWSKEHLSQVAAAFLQAANELSIEIEWGGLWRSFPDFPHIQLKG